MKKIRKIWCITLELWAKNTDFGPFWPILDHFWPKKGQFWIFGRKATLSLFKFYKTGASWKKSEKSDARISWKVTNERTDERTDGRTDERDSIGLEILSRPITPFKCLLDQTRGLFSHYLAHFGHDFIKECIGNRGDFRQTFPYSNADILS